MKRTCSAHSFATAWPKKKLNPKYFFKCTIIPLPRIRCNQVLTVVKNSRLWYNRNVHQHHLTSSHDVAKCLLKLRAEISCATLSSPVRESEAKALPYLQAVIKEWLRMWPPIGAVMFKHAPPGGDTIAGVHIPEGTKVGVCWYGISRCKASYGKMQTYFGQKDGWRLKVTSLNSWEGLTTWSLLRGSGAVWERVLHLRYWTKFLSFCWG